MSSRKVMGNEGEHRRPALGRALARGAMYAAALVAAVALLAGVAVLTLHVLGTDAVALHGALTRVKPYAFAVQLALIGALWLWWHDLLAWAIGRGWLPESARGPLAKRRNRWVGLMLVLELLMAIATG